MLEGHAEAIKRRQVSVMLDNIVFLDRMTHLLNEVVLP